MPKGGFPVLSFFFFVDDFAFEFCQSRCSEEEKSTLSAVSPKKNCRKKGSKSRGKSEGWSKQAKVNGFVSRVPR